MERETKKSIAILATGGTIAGAGKPGENLGYTSGVISADELVCAVPELDSVANVRVEQICNVNSDDMSDALWLKLSSRIDELLATPEVDGIVVTHGTDTMDETAYFLSIVVRSNKPVIVTGAMRPATSAEPDGPRNLLGAVRLATSLAAEKNCGKGNVWVFFGETLFAARQVQKCSASELQPMAADKMPPQKEPLHFEVSQLAALPKVNVVYFSVDASPELLQYAATISDGIVIAGAGAGEFSLSWSETLQGEVARMGIPVVVSTRVNHGTVTLNKNLVGAAPNVIAAGHLPPQKAAVLLRLALTQTKNPAELRNIFENA